MNIARKARHLAFVGRSGTGKSTGALAYLLGSVHDRVIIADHEGEFAHRLGLPLADNFGDFYAALEKQRVVCLDITEVSPGHTDETFDELSRQTLDLAKSVFDPKGMQVLFVIDEVQKYTSAHQVPENFKALLETGRKWGVDTLSISQRPNRLHGDLLEQFTELFFFRLINQRSQQFGDYYGVTPEEQAALNPGEYIYLNQTTGRRGEGKIFDYRESVVSA